MIKDPCSQVKLRKWEGTIPTKINTFISKEKMEAVKSTVFSDTWLTRLNEDSNCNARKHFVKSAIFDVACISGHYVDVCAAGNRSSY